MSGKQRIDGMTVERRVFYAVRHSVGPLTGPQVRIRANLEYWQTIQALGRLARGGYIRKTGSGRSCKYEPIPGKRAPKDRRGSAPASRENLLEGNPHAALAKKLVKNGYHIKAIPTTELERAWGWMPKVPFSEVASVSTICSNNSGTVRPQET